MTFVLQKDAELVRVDSTHAWIRLERERPKGGMMHQISQGVLIYKYPYTNEAQFADSNLFAVRDSILKTYIPGPGKGSYMTTEYKYVPPISDELNVQKKYAKEIRGLWKMKNGFMGGPLYTLTTLDNTDEHIVMMVGYVYAPQFDKREFTREMEAMIKSVAWK